RHQDRPFFLYLSHTMPHIPQYASPAFAGKSKDGVYGDTIEELDWSTGQILDELRNLKLAENTLVIFTSDNGANVRAAMRNQNVGGPGRAFGGSNAPLRAGKGTTFEGGIRLPCISWWPGSIAAGRVERAPCSTLDFFPTFAALANAALPPPTTLDGIDISSVLRDVPLPKTTPRLLTHYFGPQLQAVREGQWKLLLPIDRYPEPRSASLWYQHNPRQFEAHHRLWPKATLYDLTNDPGETADLAAAHPEVVARLLERARRFDATFQPHTKAVEVLPGPKPPTAGQVRRSDEDLSAWLDLIR
ncbi:MAG: N-acetylgalactosamine-6-sulfatase, partial [Verrucomicrobia bacterium]|nr:N-acetylgalactosamine-6-sulfatase [Verrucomicrobiota bacterium]